MNNILIDTHALLWYLSKDKKLPNNIRSFLLKAHKIFVPTIVLLELLYLLQKQSLTSTFSLVLDKLKKSNKYQVVSFDLEVLENVFKLSSNLESHDSIIVATAKMLKLPLVTKDGKIKEVYDQAIW